MHPSARITLFATLPSKLENDPHQPVVIQTIRDIGYRFETGD